MAPWSDDAKLGSGLPDRFLFTVAKARVGKPFPKNAEQVAVVLDGEQNVDGDVEDQHIWLKTGAFEAGDVDGTFLIHETQQPSVFDTHAEKIKKINKNSSYGKFLNGADLDALAENQDPARAKYEIWDVLFWEGLILDIEVVDEPYSFTVQEGADKGKLIEGSKRQEYVRGIVGKADVSGAPVSTAAVPSSATNGSVNPADFENHMSYLEAFVTAGGDSADPKATKAYWEAARS